VFRRHKNLIWKANGQKPNWLRELEQRGRKAVEVNVERGGHAMA
jgi:hypothetical protein